MFGELVHSSQIIILSAAETLEELFLALDVIVEQAVAQQGEHVRVLFRISSSMSTSRKGLKPFLFLLRAK